MPTLRTPGPRQRQRSSVRVDADAIRRIRQRFEELETATDRELQLRALDLKNAIRQQETKQPTTSRRDSNRFTSETSRLIDCFALTMQASRRTLGMAHYDVQIAGGLVMARDMTAEMQTGEGKTLTSTLPAVLAGMQGQGIHVCTVNAYLCKRDFQQMQPVFDFLGLTSGLITTRDDRNSKRAAYQCDITYSTGYDVGFDFLRDRAISRTTRHLSPGVRFRNRLRGMPETEEAVQHNRHKALIDEIDSVLIDEATTPLVISGNDSLPTDELVYRLAESIASQLNPNDHFRLDPENHKLTLTAAGSSLIHAQMAPGSQLARPWRKYIEQALRGQHIYKRDVHYVVKENEVCIVDEFTGRIFDDRTWRDGLHQAIECKEGVPITPEKRTIARISRQCFFQLYGSLAGMTGTIVGNENEFDRFYRLPVVAIPPRLPVRRIELPTLYFQSQSQKYNAIVRDITARQQHRQPVLVGTRTIGQSIAISELLQSCGVEHQLLNGVQDQSEADLIAASGQPATVTIATNMAGRGTDIKLTDAAKEAGGLHVIAAERSESHRIDRQLAGRAGRQGEVGSCQFFVAADDELFTRHAPRMVAAIVRQAGRSPGSGQHSRELDRKIFHLQQRCEKAGLQKRQDLLEQELWLNEFRSGVA